VTLLAPLAAAENLPDPWKDIAGALGRQGRVQSDGTYIVPFPRGSIDVTIGDFKPAPVLWMASAVTFSDPGPDAMLMGDLLLTADETGPAIARLVREGIHVTAVHNHLNRETPRLMYVHVEGHGKATTLAAALKTALNDIKLSPPPMSAWKPASDEEVAAIETAVGRKGRGAGGGVVISVPRRETVTVDGMNLPSSMGASSTLLFQSAGAGRLAISGDLVLTAAEVDPTMRTLVGSGIDITALHSHMIGEQPRLFFLHYWAIDDARRLTKALKAALDGSGHL